MASTTIGVEISTRDLVARWMAERYVETGQRLTYNDAVLSLLRSWYAERREASA
jgi:hypothetical protein